MFNVFYKNAVGELLLRVWAKAAISPVKLLQHFSSTGTPSYFVHPAEAAHGDLGMICPDDVVLAFFLFRKKPRTHVDCVLFTAA